MWVVSAFILRKILGRQVTRAPSFVWRKISQLACGLAANTAWNRAIIIGLLAGIFASPKNRGGFFRWKLRLFAICGQPLRAPLVFFVVGFSRGILGNSSFFQPSP